MMGDRTAFDREGERRRTVFLIRAENPEGVTKGVKEILPVGEQVKKVPGMAPGTEHEVRIVMGRKDNG